MYTSYYFQSASMFSRILNSKATKDPSRKATLENGRWILLQFTNYRLFCRQAITLVFFKKIFACDFLEDLTDIVRWFSRDIAFFRWEYGFLWYCLRFLVANCCRPFVISNLMLEFQRLNFLCDFENSCIVSSNTSLDQCHE